MLLGLLGGGHNREGNDMGDRRDRHKKAWGSNRLPQQSPAGVIRGQTRNSLAKIEAKRKRPSVWGCRGRFVCSLKVKPRNRRPHLSNRPCCKDSLPEYISANALTPGGGVRRKKSDLGGLEEMDWQDCSNNQ